MILLPYLLLSMSVPSVVSLAGGAAGLSLLDQAGEEAIERDSDMDEEGVDLAQMTIEQRVIIRVPMVRPPASSLPAAPLRNRADAPPPVSWEEHKGPKCIQLSQIRAAGITSSRGVDLLFRDASRLRARLGRECRPEDLYSGFYIQPNEDGSLCAGRDRLLARSGASCVISELKRLVPER